MDGNGVEDEHGTGLDCLDCWDNGSDYVASADGSDCDHWHSNCSLSLNLRRSWEEQRTLQGGVVVKNSDDDGDWSVGKAVWLG